VEDEDTNLVACAIDAKVDVEALAGRAKARAKVSVEEHVDDK
jgi:hypothetical protein